MIVWQYARRYVLNFLKIECLVFCLRWFCRTNWDRTSITKSDIAQYDWLWHPFVICFTISHTGQRSTHKVIWFILICLGWCRSDWQLTVTASQMLLESSIPYTTDLNFQHQIGLSSLSTSLAMNQDYINYNFSL